MAYTTIDDPSAYFQTILYSGNETARSITLDGNSDLQPDWVWIKQRNRSDPHIIYDSVRGTTKELSSNTNTVEHTNTAGLTSFNSDGFSIGNHVDVNRNSTTFVAWNWKAGTSFTNDASGTGIGTIDSTGSVNDTAGFSIVSYTSTGSNGSIKHGMSTAPSMIIFKRRSGDTENWPVYHQALGNTHYIKLNSNDGQADSAARFNDTSPTSSVFTVGTSGDTNGGTSPFIAYCFAEKKGYSKFGSYVGNTNANGPFVFTGFKPAFVIWKKKTGEAWGMTDNKRAPHNPNTGHLYPNHDNAEATGNVLMDFLSNGFKIRWDDGNINHADGMIYMAFAEQPFVSSSGVPATAR